MKKMNQFLVALIVSVLFLSACGAKVNKDGDGKDKEIVIGAIYPLTGSAATVGKQNKEAIELAVDIINEKHDIDLPFAETEGIPNLDGAKIKVIFADSQGKPDVAASEAQRLITREKASLIMGAYASSNAATIAQVTERSEIPFLVPDSSSPSLTENGWKWFFRIPPSDNEHVRDFFDFMDHQREEGKEIKTIAIFNENSLWGTDIADEQKKLAEEQGYEVVAHVQYPKDTTDLSSEIQKLKAANPDVLLATSYTSDAMLFIKTAKELNFQPKGLIVSGAGFVDNSFKENMASLADDIITRELWSLDLGEKKPLYKELNEEFKKRNNGQNLLGDQVKVIQGILVAADAFNRANSTEAGDIQKALLETDIPEEDLVMPWTGVQFNAETHQNEKARGILQQFKDGDYQTIYPSDLASQDVTWPFKPWDQR